MSERVGFGEKQNIPEVTPGVIYSPFQLMKLPNRFDLRPNPVNNEPPAAAEWQFMLQGIAGVLRIIPDKAAPLSEELYESPLGPAKFVPIIRRTKQNQSLAFAKAIPLTFALHFLATSQEQYRMLSTHTVELQLGNNSYYLPCRGEDLEETVLRELETKGKMELSTVLSHREDRKFIEIPSTQWALRKINVKFAELDAPLHN